MTYKPARHLAGKFPFKHILEFLQNSSFVISKESSTEKSFINVRFLPANWQVDNDNREKNLFCRNPILFSFMIKKNIFYFASLILITAMLNGCASSGRITRKENKLASDNSELVKILLDNNYLEISFLVQSPVMLMKENVPTAIVKSGNRLRFYKDGNNLKLTVQDKTFEGKYFQLKSENDEKAVKYKGKSYAGIIKIICSGNSVDMINQVPLETYLKGVVAAEMPVGKGDAYFQALKAFAICARTYTITKLGKGNLFDVYLDTRDQVYDGLSREKALANRAVDDTRNMILTYDDKPAVVFYHASCGGHTANVEDVFPGKNEPYLQGVNDGDPPNCSIAPHFNWEEKYSDDKFLQRLKTSGYLERGEYTLQNVEVGKRNSSGRVAELLVTVRSSDDQSKNIIIYGNKIRAAIRKADDSDILRSTMFDVNFDGTNVTINGKGNGHGVGLCQWGAIYQSTQGKNYKDILSFYFPGTSVRAMND
ncbi:MAG: SpoIID/LytB domain-containing protein [Ignavibacteriaceae bacterium]